MAEILDVPVRTQIGYLNVKCLSAPWELEAKCETNGLTLSLDTRQDLLKLTIRRIGARNSQRVVDVLAKDWNQDDEYEVEEILTHEKEKGVTYYLVKWKGWAKRYNTWQPRDSLNCDELIDDYILRYKSNKPRKRAIDEPSIDNAKRNKPADAIFDRLNVEETRGKITSTDIVNELKKLGGLNGLFSGSNYMKIRHRALTKKDRQSQLHISLAEWQRKLNSLLGYKTPRIFIENNVDLEGPPDTFQYVVDYREGPGVVLNNDPVIGCECGSPSDDDNSVGCYKNKKKCCAESSGHEFAYNKFKTLRVDSGQPIYECNKICACDASCPNRVVQHGQAFRLCIFRTSNGRGWGVKALQRIKRGSFVMEYLGEIITPEEAERRGKLYDSACRTYLFDLDYNGDENPYTIDGGRYGNISHFVNHSCEPNVTAYCVWINNLDPSLPRIAFFSNQVIERGEEITFDYKMTGDTTETGDNNNKYRMVCQCGSKKCRGYLF